MAAMDDAARAEHVRRLGRALDEVVALLDRVGERRWGPWLRARRAALAVDADRSAAAIVAAAGFAALVFDPAVGHDLDDEDAAALNERLDRLRTLVTAEAAALVDPGRALRP